MGLLKNKNLSLKINKIDIEKSLRREHDFNSGRYQIIDWMYKFYF